MTRPVSLRFELQQGTDKRFHLVMRSGCMNVQIGSGFITRATAMSVFDLFCKVNSDTPVKFLDRVK